MNNKLFNFDKYKYKCVFYIRWNIIRYEYETSNRYHNASYLHKDKWNCAFVERQCIKHSNDIPINNLIDAFKYYKRNGA